MSAVRIGIVGCGRAAELLYLPALKRLPQFKLAAVCDAVEERRRLIASRIDGCAVAASAEAMVKEVVLDVVAILTPPELHLETARPAIERSIPVLIEKPLAATVDDANAIRRLARDHGSLVAVGFNRRWWQPVQRLIAAVRKLGGPIEMETSITSDAKRWRAICGERDALEDLASHHLDIATIVSGARVETVAASYRGNGCRVDVTLEGGHRARIVAAQQAPSQESISVRRGGRLFRICTSSVRIEPASGWCRAGFDLMDRVKRKLTGGPSPMALSYAAQLQVLSRMIFDKEDPPASLASGIENLQAIEAARRSIRNGGKPVPVMQA